MTSKSKISCVQVFKCLFWPCLILGMWHYRYRVQSNRHFYTAANDRRWWLNLDPDVTAIATWRQNKQRHIDFAPVPCLWSCLLTCIQKLNLYWTPSRFTSETPQPHHGTIKQSCPLVWNWMCSLLGWKKTYLGRMFMKTFQKICSPQYWVQYCLGLGFNCDWK